jgi:tripartite-type tricarboxylate transporter receptor subunit TctC
MKVLMNAPIKALSHAIAVTVMLALSAGQLVFAQSYPVKPVRIVAPYPPGGIDVYIRQLAPKMSEFLGQPMVIDNRGGANGIPGTDNVARSAPDGYSLLFAVASTLVAGQFLNKNVPFDTVRDFTPIIPILDTRHGMAVFASLPLNSVRELIDFAKKNPGKLSYGSTGVGSTVHLENEVFKALTGTDILHVPYKGTAPMMTDALAGRFDISINGMNFVKPQVDAGKLKMLAVLERHRNKEFPNVPSIVEIVPDFRKPPNWAAIFGPAGLPRPIVDRVHAAVMKTVELPEIRRYIEQSADVVMTAPDQFATQIREDIAWTARVVKDLGIQPE